MKMHKRKQYIFILFLFILVGLLHVYPDLRFIHELDKDFQGISLMGASDETVYLSRIAGVIYRQDLRLANVGVYAHQHDPIFFPSLTEVIEGMIGKFFGLEVWQTDIWATFLLPVILCYLIYLLVCNLSDYFEFGILAALGVVLGYYWFTPNLKAIFNLTPDYFNLSLLFTRPISPQFHFIPFLLSLYLIYKVSLSRNFYLVLLGGLVVGALFYTSIYYWTFVYAGLGVLLIIDLIRRKTDNVKKYTLIFLFSALVSIPYLLNLHSLNSLAFFPEIFRRGGGIYTRQPIIPLIQIAGLVFLIILCFFFSKKKEQFYYMISFVSAGLICLNQQIITAKTVEPFHWQIFTNKIFIIICLFVCISFVFTRIRKTKLLFYLFCFAFFVMGIIQQNLYYSTENVRFRKLQIMAPVLRYIHKATPFDTVILTDPFQFDQERMISIYTKNYPYISDSFFITSAIQDQEIEERYFYALNFYGYTVSEAEDLFGFMNGGLFKGMQVGYHYGGTPEKSRHLISGLKKRYARLVNQNQIVYLKKYKVDYVLLTKKNQDRLFSNENIKRVLSLEYKDNHYSLYKIKDDG